MYCYNASRSFGLQKHKKLQRFFFSIVNTITDLNGTIAIYLGKNKTF